MQKLAIWLQHLHLFSCYGVFLLQTVVGSNVASCMPTHDPVSIMLLVALYIDDTMCFFMRALCRLLLTCRTAGL